MKCKHCGTDVQLPFQCNFRQYFFCMNHRLPENHKCPSAPPRLPLGSWQTKQEMDRLRKVKRADADRFASEGDFHFIKKKLPTFELPKKDKKSKFKFWERKKEEKKE